MISYEQAIENILNRVDPLDTEVVALDHARGRYLAEDVLALFDSPRFDNSAVDGYAVKVDDVKGAGANTPVVLRISGQVRAGDSSRALEEGSTISIFTGAPIHPTHEAVVMKELTRVVDGTVEILRSVKAGENIRRAGEEYRKGDCVLSQATGITPRVLGVLASIGLPSVRVNRLPRVTLIITGNELVDAGQMLGDGQIYDSNSIALSSLLQDWGFRDVTVKRCADMLDNIRSAIESAAQNSDVVVTVGGASVGDYDFVAEAATLSGFTIHHDKIAMKPGKPNLFGTNGKVLFFGLPGNPVSAFVSLLFFARPALKKMMGARECRPNLARAVLSSELRKKAGRMEFVRVKLKADEESLKAIPVKGQDSHMMLGLAKADGLLLFDKELEHLRAGDVCGVIII